MSTYQDIWNPDLTLETLNTFNNTHMVKHLDIVFTEIGDQSMSATMPVDHRTMQPFGLLHGGASAVLAETLGSVASHCIKEPLGNYVGLEVTATHLRSATEGIVTGIVTPIKLGRKIHIWQINIYQEAKQICNATLKTMLANG